MADGKKSFLMYADWQETFNSLPNDKAGELIKFLFAYVNDENPKTDDLLITAVFANIKNTLKRDLRKWESERQSRSEAGRLGGLKTQALLKQNQATLNGAKANQATLNGAKANQAVSVNVNVSDSDNIPTTTDSYSSLTEAFEEIKLDELYLEGCLRTLSGRGWMAVSPMDCLTCLKIFLHGKADITSPRSNVRQHFKNWLFREPLNNLIEYGKQRQSA